MKEVDLNQGSDDLSLFCTKATVETRWTLSNHYVLQFVTDWEQSVNNELDLQRGQMDKMRFNKLKSLKVAK